MSQSVVAGEAIIRLACFLLIFAFVAGWELLAPRRVPSLTRRARWPGNLGVLALNAVLVRLLVPGSAAGFALLCESKDWGLMNNLSLPSWIAILASIVVLDFAIYLQHVMFHAVPALWRLHRMHHADLDFDVTTGGRFHPLEILISLVIKMTVIAGLGPPAAAVLIFEVVLNATSSFNHGNILLPIKIDSILRWLVVTPDMHRVHHSVVPRETNSNFGFNLPWWDRLLGTYRPRPAEGHTGMTIGIEEFRQPRDLGFVRMLMQPFRSVAGNYPITRA